MSRVAALGLYAGKTLFRERQVPELQAIPTKSRSTLDMAANKSQLLLDRRRWFRVVVRAQLVRSD
jgi:hypothetical protein